LFNIGVANGVDRIVDEYDPSYTGASSQKSDFVRKLHGKYYLIPQNSQQIVNPNVPNRDFLLFDASSSTYYIIQIEEAVNTTKLNKSETSTNNYDALHPSMPGYREMIAGDVAKILGSRDANKTSAYNHFLKEYSIVFHDQDIWEYFKESFPDVYDTDKDK